MVYQIPKADPPPPAEQPLAVPASSGPETFAAPEGWTATPPGRMVLYAFDAGAGVTATVSRFPGDVGGLQANLARWGRQLGLAAESIDQAQAVGPSPARPAPAKRVRLDNGEQALVVDMVPPPRGDVVFQADRPRGRARSGGAGL